MEKSESIKEIASALAAFQNQVEHVARDGINPFFKSKYATFENVVNTIKVRLASKGLSYAQFPDGDGLYTIIMHTSGEWIGAHAALELKGHTPQDQGSAITYMRRYALSAALGLATEDDDDGNAASQPAKAAPVPTYKKSIKETNQDVQKREIQRLCDKMVDGVGQPLVTGEDYQKYVLGNTGLALTVENYGEIIKRLTALAK